MKPKPATSEWRPFSDPPKDHTKRLLLRTFEGELHIIAWCSACKEWEDWFGELFFADEANEYAEIYPPEKGEEHDVPV